MDREIRLVFMGVCGCGKTTLAARTAEYLGCDRVIEADEFHTPEMKQKMGAGIPLTDEDRWPWLERLNVAMRGMRQPWSVITCSALRKVYREKLTDGLTGSVRFVFLDAPKEIIKERMMRRQHEYSEEPVIRISVAGSEEETFEGITQAIQRLRGSDAS
jgi:carbohydrate kinase (thermoresistant glucokinase family)